MAKKTVSQAKHLAAVAIEREDVRKKLAVEAKQLAATAQRLAVVAQKKEEVRRKLAVSAEKLRLKAEQLAATAQAKEDVRKKLAVKAKQLAETAQRLAVVAQKKEDVRRKLALSAEKLRLKAEQLSLLNDAVESKNVELAKIADASLAFGQTLSHRDLLTFIVESARSRLGARYAALGVLDETRNGLERFVTSGLSDEEKSAIGSSPHGKGLLGVLIDDPRTLRLAHIADDSRSVGFPPHHPRMDSFLGAPVVIEGRVFGNLYFTDKVGGPFTAEDEQIASTFALEIAVALESINLHEEALELLKMSEKVLKIEHAMFEGSGIQEILEILCVSLGDMFSADRVVIRTIDTEDEGSPNAQWHSPDLPPILDRQFEQFPGVGNLADDLWNSSSVLVWDDYLAPSAQADESAQIFRRITGARSAIIAPIGIDRRALGIVYVLAVDKPRHWSKSEIGILREAAIFATHSISAHVDQLHQQEYIAQLEQLDRQKTNFVATVSHELRTPLTSITGYLELLKDGVAGDLTSEQRELLDVIDRNSIRLRALIENLLLFNRSEIKDMAVDSVRVSMNELIHNVCQEFFPLAQNRTIQLEINGSPDGAFVIGDRGQLQSAVGNIVSNALKFSHDGGVVTVSTSLDIETQMIQIVCQDHGVGIPIEDQANLFTQFFRASNATDLQIPGTGLGLTLVKQIIQDHGGTVHVTSTQGIGTTVVIDLPLASAEAAPSLE